MGNHKSLPSILWITLLQLKGLISVGALLPRPEQRIHENQNISLAAGRFGPINFNQNRNLLKELFARRDKSPTIKLSS